MIKIIRSKNGFTLLELIVVIVVAGILAAVAVPTFSAIKQSAAEKSLLQSAEAVVRNAEALAALDGTSLADTYVDAAGAELAGYNGTSNTLTAASNGQNIVATINATTGEISISGNGGASSVSTYFTTPSHTNESHWSFQNSGGTVTAVSYNSTTGTLSVTWSGSSAEPANGYKIHIFSTLNPGPLNGGAGIESPSGFFWNDGWSTGNQVTENGDGSVTFTVTNPALISGSGYGLTTAVIQNHMYNPATPLIRFVE